MFLRTRQSATLLSICFLAICFAKPTSQAHDGDHSHEPTVEVPVMVPPEVTYAPSAVPDRIVLTWAGDPTTTQSVTWRTDTTVNQGLVEYAVAEDGPLFVQNVEQMKSTLQSLKTDLGEAHYHSATLSGLKPSIKYVYRVGDGANWSEWAHFITASEQAEPFRFVYLGDAQNNIKSHWSRLIRQAYTDAPRAAFILHAGDLVNRANSDAEWGEWFYAQGFIPRSTPCVAVPGNHEQTKYVDEKSGEPKRRLTDHWQPVFEFPNNGPVDLRESVYWMDYQGARIIALNSNERVEEQAVWLEQVLRDNSQKWTIVSFHHPIYSSKRGRDNAELRNLLQPIFDKYKVDLVLNGHDHTYARTKLMLHEKEQNVTSGVRARSDVGGTVYVVSVSGPKMYDLGRRPFMKRVAEDTQLYQIITVDGDELQYVARTAVGRPYDGFTLRKRAGEPNELIEEVPNTKENVRPADASTAQTQPKKDSASVPVVQPTLTLTNPQAQDQDDMCVWRNSRSPNESLIITSDKAANRLFVYGLDGELHQSIEIPMPGNIDLRYGIPFGDQTVDLVAVNQRDQGFQLRLFRVDPETLELVAVDNGGVPTGPNYGGCLYHDRQNDRLYFFSTSKENGCDQIELSMSDQAHLVGKTVRHLDVGLSEGAVADDQQGLLYISVEQTGVWRFPADPDGDTDGTMVLPVGANDIRGDLEGIALTSADNQLRYLTVSDQGSSVFHVLPLIGGTQTLRFAVEGARESDGIEVVTASFGEKFPSGFFACHSDQGDQCPVLITPLPRILDALGNR